MGGGVLDPNDPYLLPFKVAAVAPVALLAAAAAPVVLDVGLLNAYRLLSPAQTLGGLAAHYAKTKQKWGYIKHGIIVGGLLMPGYHKNPFSSGGGGPGESPTSTEGLHKQGQPVPVVVPAASNSTHGGRRSGSKPRSRKRCPSGYRWNGKRCVRKG